MRSKDLIARGLPRGPALKAAQAALSAASARGVKKRLIRDRLQEVIDDPESNLDDEIFGVVAHALVKARKAVESYSARKEPAPWQQWGDDLEPLSVQQMTHACDLPVAVSGALMPDAHPGYGLPIGGVLATENSVIPYAVGVDIACRMKLTVLDLPLSAIDGQRDRLTKAIERETRFGIGAKFRDRREHDVLDDDWSVSEVTRRMKDRAWAQLGTSGSGNHFVEFGEIEVFEDSTTRADLGLEAGNYLALMSHSGSRGPGANVASHYSRLAMDLHPELPKHLKQLAWLDLDRQEGHEYWQAMELMGRYAAANHELIHRHLAKAVGAKVLADVENHHNFAWKEEHGGRQVIVHRKGATPAHEGVLGVIPGSMADPAFIVRGRGKAEALGSASHGAGRVMSRKKAQNTFTWNQANELLTQRRVTLLSAGLDEVPMVYKNINDVMAAQTDLVDVLARFTPRLVKMAPAGERPED